MDFKPETVAEMKKRLHFALMPTYDVDEVAAGKVQSPGTLRQHVFDTLDGLRMIISRDKVGDSVSLHISVSLDAKHMNIQSRYAAENIQTFGPFIQKILVELFGEDFDADEWWMSKGGILHLIRVEQGKEEDENQADGESCTG